MFWNWNKKDNDIKDTNIGLSSTSIQIEAMGINVKKMINFPDGARMSYLSVTDKNIYTLLDRYASHIRLDRTASNVNLKYNLGRRGIIIQDSEATIVIGKIIALGVENPYKLYYKNDGCIYVTYYYPMKNREELIVNSEKTISKSYNAQGQMVKMEETYDNQIHTYKVNPVTNEIVCSVSNVEESKA